jgi:hypothetical protein
LYFMTCVFYDLQENMRNVPETKSL